MLFSVFKLNPILTAVLFRAVGLPDDTNTYFLHPESINARWRSGLTCHFCYHCSGEPLQTMNHKLHRLKNSPGKPSSKPVNWPLESEENENPPKLTSWVPGFRVSSKFQKLKASRPFSSEEMRAVGPSNSCIPCNWQQKWPARSKNHPGPFHGPWWFLITFDYWCFVPTWRLAKL